MKNKLIPFFLLPIFLFLWASGCSPGEENAITPEASIPEVTDILGLTVEPTGDQIAPTTSTKVDLFAEARQAMVRTQIEGRGVSDQAVLEALLAVPRHEFVLPENIDLAYGDHPLPIGYGQTISQPYIVALMSEALQLEPGERVLEIGTGSGYQAAILAEMDAEVYTVEIIPELASQAEERLERLGFGGVAVLNADGYLGWEENAPYDKIIVTAAPDHLPQPLANQLNEGGRLVIPIGPVGSVQTLWVFEKEGAQLSASNLGAVRFVPLTRSEP